MSTANSYLTVAGIGVDVVYKNIKNMHISVYPPVGRVRVAAPNRLDEDAIRLAVVQRLPWIKRQRQQLQSASRQSEREMIDGESHYVWGQRLRLELEPSGQSRVAVRGKKLVIRAPGTSDAAELRGILDRWYRRELKATIPSLLTKWQPLLGVEAERVVVRRMKTKWGTCVRDSATLWFNPELAKKNPRCLEYIVVHELMHLHERNHTERFVGLMDKHLPDWRARRDELNGAPLSEEEWSSR